jgi:flavin-binding protein dodecin
MTEHIYEKVEVVGSSTKSIEDAVQNAVTKVAENEGTVRWVEVVETRCHVEDNVIAHWQVTVKVGCRME